MTAGEILAELEANPEYQLRMAKKEAERQEHVRQNREVAKPLFERLRKMQVHAESLNELVQHYAPLSEEIIKVLLEFLQHIKGKNEDVEDAVVSAIAESEGPYDGRLLAELFDSADSSALKWAIADTFSRSRPMNVGEWCVGALRDKRHDRARQMLCIAINRLVDRETARQALRAIYKDMPGHAAMGLAIVGDKRDLALLQKDTPDWHRWVAKEREKAIRKIEKRAEKARIAKEKQDVAKAKKRGDKKAGKK